MMAGTVLYQDRAMKQITFAPRNHLLTNTNTWTPDSQWLVFDVRPSGASFTGETIERVNIHTGEVEVIYRASQGAHVGVVTVHPKSEKRQGEQSRCNGYYRAIYARSATWRQPCTCL
nr:protein of unknown function (DUF4115) [uncultured bacterium]